jgi:plastocyanin
MGRLRLSHVPMLPNFLVECNLVQHMVRITGYGNVANTWCKEESMRKLSYLVTLSVIALLIFVPAAGAQQGQDVTVSIQNFAFNPPDITVTPGTTVTWVNNDSVPHTTTANDETWDSETLQPGESFSFTFDTPGTFPYFCEIHPFMMGNVTVGGGTEVSGGSEAGRAPTEAISDTMVEASS